MLPMSGRVLARRFPASATPPSKTHLARPSRHLYTPLTACASRHFSSTARIMTGSKIDGTAIAKSIRERLGSQIKERQQANPRYRPSLKIVQGESCHDGMVNAALEKHLG
jgi:hypothetical protein